MAAQDPKSVAKDPAIAGVIQQSQASAKTMVGNAPVGNAPVGNAPVSIDVPAAALKTSPKEVPGFQPPAMMKQEKDALTQTAKQLKSEADKRVEATRRTATAAAETIKAAPSETKKKTADKEKLDKAGLARLEKMKENLTKFIGKFTSRKSEAAGNGVLEKQKQATAADKDAAKKERQELLEAKKIYEEGLTSIKDLIAPSSLEVSIEDLNIDGLYSKTFYVYAYPRYLDTNWLAPIINFDITLDIAMFIYPIDSTKILKILKTKVGQMTSTIRMQEEKGTVRDPALETALQDAEELRDKLVRGEEKFFQAGIYITIYSHDRKNLDKLTKQLESILGGKLIMTKRSNLRMEQGFDSTSPLCLDELGVSRNMNTAPLSTTFPFVSSDLSDDKGILYGLNRHNNSLVIFDRFSLENANSVVFAKSGAGKSYAVKLEILRSLMMNTDVIAIDPENEYKPLCEVVGGSYLDVSLNSQKRINPFDLPLPIGDTDTRPGDLLRSNIITLMGLMNLMLGKLTPKEEAILDKALFETYALKGITMETEKPGEIPPPTMEDLYEVLIGMDGGASLATRLEQYTKGVFAGVFNKPTNIDMKAGLVVFSIRDLDDMLRPTAIYIILNYIWNRVRSKLKRRMLVIDEAWSLLQHEDSARFLHGLVKRARKYYLGVTTITQDVEDVINHEYGRAIVTNSSMQLLMKQSPASIEPLGKVFNLTEGEKYYLLNSEVGEGIFFAGMRHVAIQVIASFNEDKIITTNPEELLKAKFGESVAEEEMPSLVTDTTKEAVEVENEGEVEIKEGGVAATTENKEKIVAENAVGKESIVEEAAEGGREEVTGGSYEREEGNERVFSAAKTEDKDEADKTSVKEEAVAVKAGDESIADGVAGEEAALE